MRDERRRASPVDQSRTDALIGIIGARRACTVSTTVSGPAPNHPRPVTSALTQARPFMDDFHASSEAQASRSSAWAMVSHACSHRDARTLGGASRAPDAYIGFPFPKLLVPIPVGESSDARCSR
jgi:hypothetical protein